MRLSLVLRNMLKLSKMNQKCHISLFQTYCKGWICKNNHHISSQHPQFYQNARFNAKRKAAIFKNYCHAWNQHTKIYQMQSFIHKKNLKLRPKIPYLGIFKLEFEKKAIVIFDPAPSNSSKCKVLCKTKKYLLTKYLLWVF